MPPRAGRLCIALASVPLEGSSNRHGEFRITEAGYPYFVPYGTQPRETFVEQAFDEIVEKILDKLS